MRVWFLEGFLGPRKSLQRIRVDQFPFRMGRQEGLSLTIEYPGISREHAQIESFADGLLIRDLGSTNGTFVNRERIEPDHALTHGDIVHLADLEFRLLAEFRDREVNQKQTRQGISSLPHDMPTGTRQLQELLVSGKVTAALQPIVASDDNSKVVAYEILGRGTHPGLSEQPIELFRIAESLSQEIRLSELMRRVGARKAYQFDSSGCFFTNIHPAEIHDVDRLMDGLTSLLNMYPGLKLVLEIHESAITDSALMASLRERLKQCDIQLAYDDFGAGQARLIELAEVPPDFIKLDMSLIRDIHMAGRDKQEMVQMLIQYARERGIVVIAEGIDHDGEADFCRTAGCELLQGFLYGKPVLAA